MRPVFIFLFFCFVLPVTAQRLPWTYEAQQRSSWFDADFTWPVETWITQRLENFSGNKQERDFVIRTEYQLDRLLKSGMVTVDELSGYASKVADSLLAADTALRKKIRFYTLASSQANAWTFDRGIILITSGLFARLKNEAQLAFIIAHELAHYREKHARSTYVFQNCDDLAGCTAPVKFSKVNGYSRENEMEADREAYELLKSKQYDLNIIPSVFDLLQYDYLPVEEKKFSKHYFEDEHLVIPRQYSLGLLNPVVKKDDSHDTSGTHPSMTKRRLTMRLLLASDSGGNKLQLLPGDDLFAGMLRNARFSLCQQYLAEGSYMDAFYSAYTLLDSTKNDNWNSYTHELIAASLFGIAQTRASVSGNTAFAGYERVQGEMQQVYYFFGKLTAVETTVLALHWTYRHPMQGLRIQADKRSNDLMALLTGLYRMKRSDFSLELPPPDKYPAEAAGDVRGEVQSHKAAYNFHTYALGGLLRDSFFVRQFRSHEEQAALFIDKLLEHPPVSKVLAVSPVIRVYGDENREYFAAEERWKQAWYASLYKDSSAEMNLLLHDFFPDANAIVAHLDDKTYTTNWLMERQSVAATFYPPAWSGYVFPERYGSLLHANGQQAKPTAIPDYLLLSGIIYRSRFTTTDVITSDAREKFHARPRATCYVMLYDLHTGRLLLNERYTKKRKISRRLLDQWAKQLLKDLKAL